MSNSKTDETPPLPRTSEPEQTRFIIYAEETHRLINRDFEGKIHNMSLTALANK